MNRLNFFCASVLLAATLSMNGAAMAGDSYTSPPGKADEKAEKCKKRGSECPSVSQKPAADSTPPTSPPKEGAKCATPNSCVAVTPPPPSVTKCGDKQPCQPAASPPPAPAPGTNPPAATTPAISDGTSNTVVLQGK